MSDTDTTPDGDEGRQTVHTTTEVDVPAPTAPEPTEPDPDAADDHGE